MTPAPQKLSAQLHQAIALLARHRGDFRTADVPRNGIYFFFEQGEWVECEGRRFERIVRMGTHRRDGNLPVRLKNHFKSNCRGSVFRRHCRSAFCNLHLLDDSLIKRITANPGARIPEVETRLSAHFAANFSFACIPIENAETRLRLEAGLIALVAQFPISSPSEAWIGHHASREEIRQSGLWNTQHVRGVPLSAGDFELLEASMAQCGAE